MTAAPTPHLSVHRHVRLKVAVTALLVAAAAILATVLVLRSSGSSDVVGSGVVASDVRLVPMFTGVELSATNNATIHVGGRQRVTVQGEDNLLPLVTTRVAHGRLVIGASRGFTTTRPMRVNVTVPTLQSITLAGSGIIRAGGSVPHLTATLAGVGHLQLGLLTAHDVLAVLVGMGRIDVTATHSLDAVLVGSGILIKI
jgi:hypothetical protein